MDKGDLDSSRRPPCVLIVDDESAIRRVCSRAFRGMDVEIENAGNVKQALNIMRARPIDVVLTDIHLERLGDGVVLAEEIKLRWPEVEVLAMTGTPQLESSIAALRGGVSDYLVKPLDLSVLREKMGRLLARKKLSPLMDRRSLQEELRAAYGELQKVERAKDAVFSLISHELRTPLCKAVMAIEALKEENCDKKGLLMRRVLGESLTRMGAMVEDLLLYAKIRAAGFRAETAPTDMEKLVRETVGRLEPFWKERELVVSMKFRGNPEIPADAVLLEKAVTHLVLNVRPSS